ncbi:hypothetical protein [Cellulosilyticum ruminicola]|uniref:hypothetical protein n=1 Tax=Cellulosilyticum ruminicola TaxID=425254 RepID=UPI0006D18F00|nr:hypothetical protein [Cellulosilyticum ruminicola]
MKYIFFTMLMTLIIVVILCCYKQKKAAFIVCICGCMPGIGILLVGGYYIIQCLMQNVESGIERLEEGQLGMSGLRKSMDQLDHLVAVSEALVLNDTKIKKEVLIGVLREDKTKYIETLKGALKDKDIEASHYAAVALIDIKDDFQEEMDKCIEGLKQNPNDVAMLIAYEAVLEKSILSGLYETKRLKQLEEIYSNLLIKLIAMEINTYKYYHSKIKCEMRLKQFKRAYTDCMAFKEAYEESEEPYLCLMEYYYLIKDYSGLCSVIEEIKASSITLSRTGIQNMRFWLGGMT